jgi:hypothetical protein
MSEPRRDVRRERGSALLVAVLMLVLMGAIGLAGLNTVTQDRQTAGFQSRKRVAFYAAEAGIAEGRETMRNGATPTVSTTTVGDSSSFPHGLPSYQPEDVTDLGTTAVPGFQLRTSGNGPTYQLHFFRVRVQGQAAGGTTARVEVVANTIDSSS